MQTAREGIPWGCEAARLTSMPATLKKKVDFILGLMGVV